MGERHGLALEPGLYDDARVRAIETLQHNHELVHDEEIWIAFTEQIVLGMGGDPRGARECATDMVREWERHENFSLYEDALPVLDELRRHEIRIGLISNGQRDLDEFVVHHVLEVDAVVGSKAHGRVKPHASIFVAALQMLGVAPDETVMVGDSYEDDIEGARALGIRAILLDRDGLRVDAPDRIDTLLALPAALGLASLLARRARSSVCAPSGTMRGAAGDPNAAAASSRVETGPTQTSSPSKCTSQSARVRATKTDASSAVSAS